MHIGAPRLNQLFNRVSLQLALLLFLAQARPALWAQDKKWDKHIKAGDKTYIVIRAEKEFQAAFARTQAFPRNDLRTAMTLSKFAALYGREHKYAEAETRQKQAVAIFESSVQPDDPRLACAMIGLALVYEFEEKREESAPIWDRYFPVLQKLARPLDPEVLSAMIAFRSELHDLGMTYGWQHRDSDVEAAETAILEIDEKVFGSGPETGNDARSLGQRYKLEGRYGAAYPLLLRSMAISRKAHEKEKSVSGVHRDAAAAWDVTVAMVELPLFHEGMPGPFVDAHSKTPYELFRQYKELAQVAFNSGKYPEADQLYNQILSMDEKDASSNKKYNITDRAGDWVDLSRVYRHEHRYNDALDVIRRCKVVDELAAKVKSAGPKEEIRLHWYSQNELAEIYREEGDLAAARPLFERSMEMMKEISLGMRHPRIAELQSDYAAFLVDEGKFDEAESAYKQALDTWANRYSWNPEQLEHAEALANYATLLRKLNRPAEAETLEAQASAIRVKATGSSTVN